MTDGDNTDCRSNVSHTPDGRVTAIHDWGGSRPISITVLEALEESIGKDPRSYGPLNDIVDVDALDSLFRPTGAGTDRGPGSVTLEIEDHTVTVHSDGSVVITPCGG